MSYIDLRDFNPELTLSLPRGRVSVEKLGGGGVGKVYSGVWRYIVWDDYNNEIARGQDFITNTPKTHKQAAKEIADIFGVGEGL